MVKYWADDRIPIGLWEEEAEINFGNSKVYIKFSAEPPFGDFIYSVKLGEKELDFWIYFRTTLFFDTKYMLAEKVEKGTFGPIKTVLIDIESGDIKELDDWYNEYRDLGRDIKIYSSHNNKKINVKEIV